jgi:hypothetical protein
VALCALIVSVGVWIVLSVATPWVLGDDNRFMKDFLSDKILSFLGVIVTITLASIANLHLELNKIEQAAGRRGFPKARLRLRQSAAWMIAMLLIAVALDVVKPLVNAGEVAASLLNGASLLIVIFNVLILIDISQMVFQIEPNLPSGK